MKTQKFTKVQAQVMARFDRGERLVIMPTNRMSGDAIFWVMIDEEDGVTRVIEKALYPQLRRLFWGGYISRENGMILNHEELTFEECDHYTLHREGCIGF
jgi:hypothetical protein